MSRDGALEADENVEVDPVFLGMTRPPMALGVTYSFFIVNLFAATIVFLATGRFLSGLLALIPNHLVGVLVCLREPRFFGILRVGLSRTPRVRNRRYWQCQSYQP